MAKAGCFRDGVITVNGVNLSDHCESITDSLGTAKLPSQCMGDTYEYNDPGLLSWSVGARFIADFASANVYATLKTMMLARAKHNVVWAHASGAKTATNPSFSGLAFIESMSPILGGERGGQSLINVTWAAAGALTELTA